MATNQGDRQASVRAITGTAYNYEGDWLALFDSLSVPAGDFNGRLIAYINQQLSTSFVEINGAMQAFAISQGAPSWNELGTFTASGGGGTSYLLLADGASRLLLADGASKLIL